MIYDDKKHELRMFRCLGCRRLLLKYEKNCFGFTNVTHVTKKEDSSIVIECGRCGKTNYLGAVVRDRPDVSNRQELADWILHKLGKDYKELGAEERMSTFEKVLNDFDKELKWLRKNPDNTKNDSH